MHEIEIQDSLVNIWYNSEKQAQILIAGATLNELLFDSINVIKGYDLEKEIDFSSCRSGWLYPFPNRIEDGIYSYNKNEYRWPVNEEAKNNAIHGYAYTSDFQLVSHQIKEGSCELVFVLEKKEEEFFPFHSTLEVRYVFGKDALNIFLKVKNHSTDAMPFGMGWHPYFKLDEDLERLMYRFPVAEKIEVNERMIPTGRKSLFTALQEGNIIELQHFDTGYVFRDKNNEITLSSERIEICMKLGEEWGYFQAFTPAERDCIALEPMTCNINAFNNKEGLMLLQPDGEFAARLSLSFRKL